MEILTAVLLASACAGLTALAARWRSRRGEPRTTHPPAPAETQVGPARDQLEDLHPQDVVLFEGMELVCTGLAGYEERDLHWLEARLTDATTERWLLVREQDPDAALVGERIPDLDLGAQPSEALEHAGKVYHLERCGQAHLTVKGDLGGIFSEAEYRIWDYRRPGHERLWIRQGPEGTSTFAGQRVGRHLLCVLPGS